MLIVETVVHIPSEKIEVRSNTITTYISFVGPPQTRLGSCFIKVDFTLNEKVLFIISPLFIHSFYSDTVKKQINTYSLEEIMIEKLCAIRYFLEIYTCLKFKYFRYLKSLF